MNYYPWYIDDWNLSETRIQLDLISKGLYRELLDNCYYHGSLPTDEESLRKMAGCTKKEFNSAWPKVRPHFVLSGNRFHNLKVDEVLPKMELKLSKAAASGRASGRARRERTLNERSTNVELELRTNVELSKNKEQKTNPPLDPPLNETAPEPDLNIHERIVAVTANWPTPAGLHAGVRLLADVVCQAANPATALQTIEVNLPTWATHYREQEPRFRRRLDNLVRDGDWMSAAPAAAPKAAPPRTVEAMWGEGTVAPAAHNAELQRLIEEGDL